MQSRQRTIGRHPDSHSPNSGNLRRGTMFKIGVVAKTDASVLRWLTVEPATGHVTCDCDGFDGVICSHVDAVLIAGERAMIRPEDVEAADAAMLALAGKLITPPHWKGSWRQNKHWRGLSRATPHRRVGSSGLPVVCFTGGAPPGWPKRGTL